MAHCSLLEETEREIAAVSVAEVGNMAEATPMGCGGGALATSDDKGHVLSRGESSDSTDEGISNNENSQTYCFGALTITQGHIREMVDKGYFTEGEARAPREEITPEPDDDKDIVFEDFFCCSLRMPPHSALADVLLKFQA
jgi:hypothetical protein